MNLLTLFLLFLFIIALILGSLVYFFGWWGFLAAAAALAGIVLAIRKLGGRIALELFKTPFRMKGKPLHNAQVIVHAVRPAEAPQDEDSDFEDGDLEESAFESPEEYEEYRREIAQERADEAAFDARSRWLELELTITPTAPLNPSGFQLWEPDELLLVRPGAKPDAEFDGGEASIARVARVSVWDAQQDAFTDDFDMKLHGEQRIRMLAAIDRDLDRVALQYYFEVFGDIELPS